MSPETTELHPETTEPLTPHAVVKPLQAWAETNLRDLPWRRTRDPWHILVSEVMLQQTQVHRVIDRYREFLDVFPTVQDCAAAPSSAVIELWAGLGYNRRAVNLWKAAGAVVADHGGRFPQDQQQLLALPGVGPYTSRALLAFAFEHDVGVVDTNVGRLLARWSGTTLTARQAQTMADDLVPTTQGWRWNQSLFDFAVAQCTKRDPACDGCPLAAACAWAGTGDDPAQQSAGVSTGQSRFEGSVRQVRGRIVAAMREAPVPRAALTTFARPDDDLCDVLAIAHTLVADGLAIERDGSFQLPD